MDDQGASYEVGELDSVRIEKAVGVALVAKKGEQVAGVLGMWKTGRIVMISCSIKGEGAVSCFMDVHSVELTVGRDVIVGQPVYFRFDHNAAKRHRIEVCDAVEQGILGIPHDFGICAGIRTLFHRAVSCLLYKIVIAYAVLHRRCWIIPRTVLIKGLG